MVPLASWTEQLGLGVLRALDYPRELFLGIVEIGPVLRRIARELGPDAVLRRRGERVLIVHLHVDAGSRFVQAYCAMFDAETLDWAAARRFDFHQRGQELRRSSWVWFPRLSEEGATSYYIRGGRGRYEWCVRRVLPAAESCSRAVGRKQLTADLGSKIAQDFRELRAVLEAAVARA